LELCVPFFRHQRQNVVAGHQLVVLVFDLNVPDHHTLRRAVGGGFALVDFSLAGEAGLDGVAGADGVDEAQGVEAVVGEHGPGAGETKRPAAAESRK